MASQNPPEQHRPFVPQYSPSAAQTAGVVVVVVAFGSVVVVTPQQSSGAFMPTARWTQLRASVAVIEPSPEGSQMHAGSQVAEPIAACRMNRQSKAVGEAPSVLG